MKGVISAGVLFATLLLATGLPSEGTTKNKEIETRDVSQDLDDDFPTFDDEKQQTPFMMRIIGGLGRIFSSVTQLPGLMARMFNFFVAAQPFAKLREEMRNLNISYPKTRLLF